MLSTIGIKQIIGIIVSVILIAGVGVGVYLVRQQQTIKSRAAAGSFVTAFEIKDKNGNIINCDSSTNPPTCNIPLPYSSDNAVITVKVKDPAPLLP